MSSVPIAGQQMGSLGVYVADCSVAQRKTQVLPQHSTMVTTRAIIYRKPGPPDVLELVHDFQLHDRQQGEVWLQDVHNAVQYSL